MRVNTLTENYTMTADYYDYREATDVEGVGIIREHFFDRTIKVRIIMLGSSRMALYTQEPLRIGGRLANIKDVSGKVLAYAETRPTGYQYHITFAEPVLNAFGFQDSMRFEAERVKG